MVFPMILFAHENNRCPLAACPRPGSVAATRRRGGSQRDDADRGGPGLRSDPADRGQVGGRLGGGGEAGGGGETTRAVGRSRNRWGLTPQKPRRGAFEQDPAAVRRWLSEEYPAIRWAARQAGAEIHWGDEMGLRSDHQTGTSYGRRGQTPVIPGTGQRFRCNMISTLTNRGRLAFMVFRERFTAHGFLRFLRRLVRQVKRRGFLIVDRHPVHRAASVTRWLARRFAKVLMFF